MTAKTPAELGAAVGRAIALDIVKNGRPHGEWRTLDSAIADEFEAAGIEPGTPAGDEAEAAAQAAFTQVFPDPLDRAPGKE